MEKEQQNLEQEQNIQEQYQDNQEQQQQQQQQQEECSSAERAKSVKETLQKINESLKDSQGILDSNINNHEDQTTDDVTDNLQIKNSVLTNLQESCMSNFKIDQSIFSTKKDDQQQQSQIQTQDGQNNPSFWTVIRQWFINPILAGMFFGLGNFVAFYFFQRLMRYSTVQNVLNVKPIGY